jgi:fructose-1,6-bisphosphatase I
MREKGQSLQSHLLDEVAAKRIDEELAQLLLDLVRPANEISVEVNRAGLVEILGFAGQQNVHGEDVKKLDVFADGLLVASLRETGSACGMASEEQEDIIAPSKRGESASYLVFFDPLDGSSNIDVNVSIGTIFGVYRRKSAAGAAVKEDFLRKGVEQAAAGYFLYGTSTMLVYTTGHGVHAFTLDPAMREFRAGEFDIKTPARGKIYSCNEGNSSKWDEPTLRYVESVRTGGQGRKPYTSRYVGSFVADFHRNLLKGGIFLYPEEVQASGPPKGKLRLMYEGNPMAMIVEQAGGLATDGARRILNIQCTDVHHRTVLVIGSKDDVEEYLSFYK